MTVSLVLLVLVILAIVIAGPLLMFAMAYLMFVLPFNLLGNLFFGPCSEESCNSPNSNCDCDRCVKGKKYYRAALEYHSKLDNFHQNLSNYGTQLGFSEPLPEKFPFLEQTVNWNLINNYEQQLNNFHERLIDYQKKLKGIVERSEPSHQGTPSSKGTKKTPSENITKKSRKRESSRIVY